MDIKGNMNYKKDLLVTPKEDENLHDDLLPLINEARDHIIDKIDGGGDAVTAQVEKELAHYMKLDNDGNIELDEARKPIFDAGIEWYTNNSQLILIWTCAIECLNERLVPFDDIGAVMELIEKIAHFQQPNNSKPYRVKLPINYFVGTWHVLNTSIKTGIMRGEKKTEQLLEETTMFFAKQIDMFQSIKKQEMMSDQKHPLLMQAKQPAFIDTEKNKEELNKYINGLIN